MSERIVVSSPDRVGEAPSCTEAPVQSQRRVSTGMMLASRPRTYDFNSESIKAGFETAVGDGGEESQYYFTSSSNNIGQQAFPTSTVVHLSEKKHHQETHGREKVVQYEIIQNGLKFKGNVKGIKITATQVTSKTGHYASEYHQSTDEEQKQRLRGLGKEHSGFVNQSGALFLQSVTDSEAEVSQHVGGKELYKVKQDAVEVEGDVTECSFNNIDQRVW